jgi:hypothetical protein
MAGREPVPRVGREKKVLVTAVGKEVVAHG